MTLGTQAVSSVTWRGLQYTSAPSLQPWIEASWGPASIGAAGSWAADGSWSEQDVSASVEGASPAGTVALLVGTHFFPADARLDSPVTEAGLEYATGWSVPLRLLVTSNVAHDPDRAAQAELGLAHVWGPLSAELFGGVALNRSAYYEARAGDVLQLGLALDHALPSARGLGMSLGAAAVYSPAHARSWFVARAAVALPFGAGGDDSTPAGPPPPRP